MKKMMLTLIAMLTMTVSANAMSYEQARNEALFLTDKMAYELNLTDEQYEAAYEINLDYLMGVTGRADVFGTYWERRNLDLSYILLDWQWEAYMAATYFYRPLYWEAGYWHFGIYRRYPHRDFFYFGRPAFYATYRGGHAWHLHGGHGYYYGHREHFRAPRDRHFGMHDRWDRGDFRNHRNSSTRVTGVHNHNRQVGGNRDRGFENRHRRIENRGVGTENRNKGMENRNRSLENRSGRLENNRPSRNNFSGSSSHNSGATQNNSGPSRSSGSFSNRSQSSGSHSSSPRSSNGGSFSSSPRSSSGSFSSGSRGGGASHSSGASRSSGSSHSHGSFGGRR
jgi:hypothetical protein